MTGAAVKQTSSAKVSSSTVVITTTTTTSSVDKSKANAATAAVASSTTSKKRTDGPLKQKVTSSTNAATIAAATAATSKEVQQNELNQSFEYTNSNSSSSTHQLRTSTPLFNKSSTARHSFASPTSAANLNDVSLAAYKEYREAGEYWNKYPKTDYTYSKLSPHRRELAPGIVAMPNMSRNSLTQHHGRVDLMVLNNPAQETYIRTRYQQQQTAAAVAAAASRKYEQFYDSQDENDAQVLNGAAQRQQRYSSNSVTTKTSIVTRFVSVLIAIWSASTSVFRRSDSSSDASIYYTRIEEEQSEFIKDLLATIITFKNIFLYILLIMCRTTIKLLSKNVLQMHRKHLLY